MFAGSRVDAPALSADGGRVAFQQMVQDDWEIFVALLARLRANLKSETTLKAAGMRAFEPIAAEVRQVLAHASPARVFGYE